jgi:hypothetical protein
MCAVAGIEAVAPLMKNLQKLAGKSDRRKLFCGNCFCCFLLKGLQAKSP